MGFLTTFSVYNDDCDLITKRPKAFAEAIYNACCDDKVSWRTNVFYGTVIPQSTRHSDDKTIYVHAGNTVCEINSHSGITREIMRDSPEFFEEMLAFMEKNVKDLRKKFNEQKKNNEIQKKSKRS